MATVAAKTLSLPEVVYAFRVTGTTNDGSTLNTLTLTGFPEGFVAHGAILQVVTTTVGVTADVGYATYDESTLAAGAAGSGTVTLGLYVKTLSTNAAIVNVLVY